MMPATCCAVFQRIPTPTESAPPVVSGVITPSDEKGDDCRERSTTVKKCSLSRMIGPPKLNPYWARWVVVGLKTRPVESV